MKSSAFCDGYGLSLIEGEGPLCETCKFLQEQLECLEVVEV